MSVNEQHPDSDEVFYSGLTLELNTEDKNWNGLTFHKFLTPNPTDRHETSNPQIGCHVLGFLSEGSIKGEQSTNNGAWHPFEFRTHELFLGPANQNSHVAHWNRIEEDGPNLALCQLYLTPNVLAQHAMEAINKPSEQVELLINRRFRDPLIIQLALTLMKEAEQNSAYELSLVQTAASFLSVHLLGNYCSKSFKISEYSDKPTKIQNVLDYIEANVAKNISIDVLAREAHMSSYHFIRTFKDAMGISPHKYIVQVRVNQAKRMLSDTNLDIAEIGRQLGYSVSHFTQVFRQSVGCTPRIYRKQNTKSTLFVT